MTYKIAAALLAIIAALPASAEVKTVSPAGFEVESKAVVPASPAETYNMLGSIGDWWNPAHSYSGKSGNLRLEPRAGGCFCETTDGGGSVEHMRVVFAQPGSMLRLQGGLGPLQGEGAIGTLTWQLKPSGSGTEIVQTYISGGFVRGGADKLAPLVDQVLAEQLSRLGQRLRKP